MSTDLKDRVAVVLGGTKGIGREIALRLCESGATVVIQGRDEDAAERVLDDMRSLGKEGMFVPANLYDYDSVALLMETAVRTHGRIDIVVASGGTADPKGRPFLQTEPEMLHGYYTSRALHRVYALHAASKIMAKAGYGKLIVITTDAGKMPTPGESMIGAAAASLIFLTRSLGRELARHGIRLNTICTSLTSDTPPFDRYRAERDDGSNEVILKSFEKIERLTPFHINTPADIAELALYLAAPESDNPEWRSDLSQRRALVPRLRRPYRQAAREPGFPTRG